MTSNPQAHTPFRQFSWAGLLATLVAVTLFLCLGFWQLARAAEKAAYLETLEQAHQQAPAPLADRLAEADPHLMPVIVSGQFDNRRHLLLDNRMHQHRAGYHVLTPFITDQGQMILVNRGWRERAPEREDLPVIAPIDGHQTLTGHLYRPSRAFLLHDDILDPHAALPVVQSIDLPSLGQWYGATFLPFELRLDGDTAPNGQNDPLVRIWQETVMGPDTHYGYAIQWFSFALIALLVFMLASRRRLAPGTPEGSAA